jgi:hypothetical protein
MYIFPVYIFMINLSVRCTWFDTQILRVNRFYSYWNTNFTYHNITQQKFSHKKPYMLVSSHLCRIKECHIHGRKAVQHFIGNIIVSYEFVSFVFPV